MQICIIIYLRGQNHGQDSIIIKKKQKIPIWQEKSTITIIGIEKEVQQ